MPPDNPKPATSVQLVRLAELLRQRNGINNQIACLISRPSEMGHIGEYIAAAVFDIELYFSATHKAADGVFRSGPLVGRTVNVKFYGKQEGLIDIREDALPDFFLVLTGPVCGAISSRGSTRPTVIEHVYLFDAKPFVASLKAKGRWLGVATSVPQAEWKAAEIWPETGNPTLPLGQSQVDALSLFRGDPVA